MDDQSVISREKAFFVIDDHRKGSLLGVLQELGEEFEQDSLLFLPEGSAMGKTQPFLLGTNADNPRAWPLYGNKAVLEVLAYALKAPPSYATYFDGRPLIFEDNCRVLCHPHGMIWMAIGKWAKQNWRDIEVYDSEVTE